MVRPSSCLLACCLLACLLLVQPASAYPSQSNYYRDEPSYDPEEIIELLNRIGNIIQMERKMETIKDAAPSDKRSLGLDFGVGRGHTGSLQAHYLMGVAAANGADGPGRKRRNA